MNFKRCTLGNEKDIQVPIVKPQTELNCTGCINLLLFEMCQCGIAGTIFLHDAKCDRAKLLGDLGRDQCSISVMRNYNSATRGHRATKFIEQD